MTRLAAYFAVWRPDHWFKNVFVLAGTLAAVVHPSRAGLRGWMLVTHSVLALVVCSLGASVNYIINEILDAERDALHPVKHRRPVPSGLVSVPLLWATAVALAALVLAWSYWAFGSAFAVSMSAFLVQGLVYNVPPIRTKEIVHLDVLTESVNNPIRLLLGWYAAGRTELPPMSLFFGYWVLGAFLMTAKRFAEYRFIGDSERAAAYRSSFRHYTEESLLIGMICYAALAMFCYGVLIVRYRQYDLFLSVPPATLLLAWFFHLAFREDSIVKEPERLWQEPAFALFSVALFLWIVFLAAVDLSALWHWVNDLRIGPPLDLSHWPIYPTHSR